MRMFWSHRFDVCQINHLIEAAQSEFWLDAHQTKNRLEVPDQPGYC
jgi:hypothetical protein